MADESTPQTPQTPEAAPAAPATPDPPARDVVDKARYDDVNARLQAAEAALRAIGTPANRQALPPNGTSDDIVNTIAQRLGTTPDEVRNYLPTMGAYFDVFAQPIVNEVRNVVATLADNVEHLRARTSFPDYKDYESDIAEERRLRASQNQYLSPVDAYHLVRARKMPEIVARERQQALAEAQRQREQAGQIGGEPPGMGRTPGTQPSTVTRDQFERMTLEEKEAYLDGKVF